MEKGKYSVELKSCGNVDHGEDPYEPMENVKDSIFRADDMGELQKAVRRYIEQYALGSSNYSGGDVRDENGEKIGTISYNGRYWEGDRLVLEAPK